MKTLPRPLVVLSALLIMAGAPAHADDYEFRIPLKGLVVQGAGGSLPTTPGESAPGETTPQPPAQESPSDGTRWEHLAVPNTFSLAFGDSRFIRGGNFGALSISTDGRAWQSVSHGVLAQNISAISFGGSVFAAAAFDGIMTSPDGQTWTRRTSKLWQPHDMAYGNGVFVVVGAPLVYGGWNGGGVLSSSDGGVTWVERDSKLTAQSITIRGVAYGPSGFVVGGDNGRISRSADGATWQEVASPFGGTQIRGVAWGNDRYVIVADGSVALSTDGSSWTRYVTNTGFTRVTFANNVFVASASSAGVHRLYTSPDGITWTAQHDGFGSQPVVALTHGNGKFLAGSTSSMAITLP